MLTIQVCAAVQRMVFRPSSLEHREYKSKFCLEQGINILLQLGVTILPDIELI